MKRWSEQEDLALIENVHRISGRNTASILPGRTPGAVLNRMRRLGLAHCGTSYNHLSYRPSEVATVCGVSRTTVMVWLRRDMLRGYDHRDPLVVAPSARQRAWYYRIPYASVDQFVWDYPMLFSPRALAGTIHAAALLQAHPEHWINTKEAARIIKADLSTVRKAGREGHLAGRQVLRHWYFRRQDVERFQYTSEVKHRAQQSTRNQSGSGLRSPRAESAGPSVGRPGPHAT